MPLGLAAPAVSTVTTADDGWYRRITSFAQHTTWLHGAMDLYTVAAIVLLAVMGVYALWSARARADRMAMAAAAWLWIGTAISVACGLGLKQVFQETRPCLAIHVATVQACPGPTDYAFPSDHTLIAVALAVGLWIFSRRLGIIAAVLAVVEGFSRVYLGQHYPHDVLASIVLGTAIMVVGWVLVRGLLVRLVGVLEATPLRPLLTSGAAAAAADSVPADTSRDDKNAVPLP